MQDIESTYGIKKGEILGVLTHADGTEETFHQHIDPASLSAFVKNLIVDRASILMAQHMKGDSVPGITYLAVGTGTGTGTTQNPQSAVSTANKLRSELTRKLVQIAYYDTNNATGTTLTDGQGRSNILDISVTFNENEAVGALTEMGLFGGNATAAKDSGDMVNFKTFAVWNKPASSTLAWKWRLTF